MKERYLLYECRVNYLNAVSWHSHNACRLLASAYSSHYFVYQSAHEISVTGWRRNPSTFSIVRSI